MRREIFASGPRMRWALYLPAFISLLVLFPATARSIMLHVDYTVNYYPPNPCEATELAGNTLDNTELSGTITLYYHDMRADRVDPIELVSVNFPPNP